MSLLTKSTAFIIGPVATLLGYVMNGIFWVLEKVGIPNIALAIILFTIVIYMLMLPLTYRQQKFSRMTPLMNPELNAIRDKYKGKNDQQSMQRMNEETQLVYAKYGILRAAGDPDDHPVPSVPGYHEYSGLCGTGKKCIYRSGTDAAGNCGSGRISEVDCDIHSGSHDFKRIFS